MHLPIGEVAPAGGAAAGGALGLAGLFVFVAGVALLGLHYGWAQTFGKALTHVSSWIRSALSFSYGFGTIDVGGPLADAVDWANHAVESFLADGAESCLHAAAWCFDEAGAVFWWSVHETERLAADTYRAFDTLFTVTIPRLERRGVSDLKGLLRTTEAELAHLLHGAEHGLQGLVHHVVAEAEHELHRLEHAISVAIPHAGYLEREIESLRKRFGTLEKRLSHSALVALIGATIFDRFGLGGLRCPGWIRFFNKNSCGLGSLLSDIVDGIIAVMVVEDICAITHEASAIAESSDVQGFLTSVVDGMDDLLTCQGVQVAPALTGPYYTPPPVQPYAVLG